MKHTFQSLTLSAAHYDTLALHHPEDYASRVTPTDLRLRFEVADMDGDTIECSPPRSQRLELTHIMLTMSDANCVLLDETATASLVLQLHRSRMALLGYQPTDFSTKVAWREGEENAQMVERALMAFARTAELA